MGKTWNFGIVGSGMIADFHARAINDIPNAKLIGFYDIVDSKAKSLADKHNCKAYQSCDSLIGSEEIDIITIATPSGLHAEPAIAAAKAGKHVICEKPLDVTLERIDSMIEAHKSSGTKLGGVFPFRFGDNLKPLREAIKTGRFGTITYAGVYVPWWRSDEYYKDSWHGTWKLDGGGAVINQSLHFIDLLCHLMWPIESIQAFTATLGHGQMEAEDTAAAVLRFGCGALGVIYGSTASYPGQPGRLEITGTKGTVVCTDDTFTTWQFSEEKPGDKDTLKKFSKAQIKGGASDPKAISHQGHTRNFQQFIDALENGEEFCLNGAESRKAVEVVLTIYESAKSGKLVKLS